MADAELQRAVALHKTGRIEESISLYRQVVAKSPLNFEALMSLGMALYQLRRLDEAQDALGRAVKINPSVAECWCGRGLALLQLRRWEEAIPCFDRAIAIRADFADALSGRATALLEVKRTAEALRDFDRVLKLSPRDATIWYNAGNANFALERYENALESYERALSLKPDLGAAQEGRALALAKLGRETRLPPLALRTLFDTMAPNFDQLMRNLSYSAPRHLRELAGFYCKAPLSILDLGCGTGLSGEAFSDLARGGRLDGIDLSPKMIEAARARGIYTDLTCADFVTGLDAMRGVYDLVLSADALIYVGDLALTFAGVSKRLAGGGYFLFSVESKDGEGWELGKANRYRHSRAYLTAEAATAGFDWLQLVEFSVRSESARPVPGFAVALRKGKGI